MFDIQGRRLIIYHCVFSVTIAYPVYRFIWLIVFQRGDQAVGCFFSFAHNAQSTLVNPMLYTAYNVG